MSQIAYTQKLTIRYPLFLQCTTNLSDNVADTFIGNIVKTPASLSQKDDTNQVDITNGLQATKANINQYIVVSAINSMTNNQQNPQKVINLANISPDMSIIFSPIESPIVSNSVSSNSPTKKLSSINKKLLTKLDGSCDYMLPNQNITTNDHYQIEKEEYATDGNDNDSVQDEYVEKDENKNTKEKKEAYDDQNNYNINKKNNSNKQDNNHQNEHNYDSDNSVEFVFLDQLHDDSKNKNIQMSDDDDLVIQEIRNPEDGSNLMIKDSLSKFFNKLNPFYNNHVDNSDAYIKKINSQRSVIKEQKRKMGDLDHIIEEQKDQIEDQSTEIQSLNSIISEQQNRALSIQKLIYDLQMKAKQLSKEINDYTGYTPQPGINL